MNTYTIYSLGVFAIWAVFIIYWAVSAARVKKDVERAGNRWQWFGPAVIAIIIASFLFPALNERVIPLNNITGPIALAASALGIGYAIWARRHLGKNWSATPALKEDHALVTSGPYRLVRHPIYTGVLLAFVGSIIVSTALWMILLAVVAAMFIWRVNVEEALMTREFPNEYPEYKKKTWALVPFVW